jgi:MFS family permease
MMGTGWNGQSPRDEAWNFRIAVAENSLFWIGYSFLSPVSILPLFVNRLTPSLWAVSIVTVINTVAWSLPQLLSIRWASGIFPRMKFLMPVGAVGRIGLVLLSAATFFLAADHPVWMLLCLYLFFSAYRASSGAMAPVWWGLIADLIPPQRRGLFYGLAQFFGTGFAVVGTLLAGYLLGRFPYPLNFALAFTCGTVLAITNLSLFGLTREPVREEDEARPARAEPALSLIRSQPSLSHYLVGRVLIVVGTMATGFYSIFALRSLGATEVQVALQGVYLLIAQTATSLVGGLWGDRRGHKLTIEVGALAQAAAAILAFSSPSITWFPLVFIAVGISHACVTVAEPILLLEFAGRTERATALALFNTVLAPVAMVAPLLGAYLIGLSGFPPMFLLTVLLSVAGWGIIHFRVTDPRRRPVST